MSGTIRGKDDSTVTGEPTLTVIDRSTKPTTLARHRPVTEERHNMRTRYPVMDYSRWLPAMTALTFIREAPNAAAVCLLLTAYLESAGAQLSGDEVDPALFHVPVRNAAEVALRKRLMTFSPNAQRVGGSQTIKLREVNKVIDAALTRLNTLTGTANSSLEGIPARVAPRGIAAISPQQQRAQDH
jgi:hypothetical protein